MDTSEHIGNYLRDEIVAEEYEVKKKILVSNDPLPRLIDDILILPWQVFLERLWADEII